MARKRGSGERVKRTEAEWLALKEQRAAEAPPDPPTGHLRVRVDDQYEFAPTAEYLRSKGFKVEIYYRRYFKTYAYTPFLTRTKEEKRKPQEKRPRYRVMNPKGGSTRVLLLRADGVWGEGVSHCVAKDVFSKKVGYVLAVQEALQQVEAIDLPGAEQLPLPPIQA